MWTDVLPPRRSAWHTLDKKVTALCWPRRGGTGTLLQRGAGLACLLPVAAEALSEMVSYNTARVPSRVRRPEVWRGSHWARVGVWGGLFGPFWRLSGKLRFLAPDPMLGLMLCFQSWNGTGSCRFCRQFCFYLFLALPSPEPVFRLDSNLFPWPFFGCRPWVALPLPLPCGLLPPPRRSHSVPTPARSQPCVTCFASSLLYHLGTFSGSLFPFGLSLLFPRFFSPHISGCLCLEGVLSLTRFYHTVTRILLYFKILVLLL